MLLFLSSNDKQKFSPVDHLKSISIQMSVILCMSSHSFVPKLSNFLVILQI